MQSKMVSYGSGVKGQAEEGSAESSLTQDSWVQLGSTSTGQHFSEPELPTSLSTKAETTVGEGKLTLLPCALCLEPAN